MRLARKITLAIAAAILAIMVLHAYVLLQREVVLFDADLARSVRLKHMLRASIEAVWQAYGEDAAQQLVEHTIGNAIEGVQVRWLWLDVPAGDPRHVGLAPDQLAQLRDGVRVILKKNGGRELVTYVPEWIAGARPAVLEFVESIGEQHAFFEASRWQIALATLAILAAAATAVYGLGAWYVGRPIEQLRDRLRAIAAGDLDTPLILAQNDEIGDLAGEIDGMRRRLGDARQALAAETEARMTALEQLRHTDRLTTIGQLAAGVAHELGTPLAVIAGRAEMIAGGEASGERATACAHVVVEQAEHMATMIRQLLDFSRHRAPRLGLASARTIVARTVDTLTVVARPRRITLATELGDDPLLVSADEHQIQQALVNLIVNAMQAMPDGGRIEVTTGERRVHPPGEHGSERDFVAITVADHGSGIPPENLPRLFEPFFTTKGPGEGTGLGLSVAHGIVRDHGGWITVESEIGYGSRFVIWLPAASAAKAPPHRAA